MIAEKELARKALLNQGLQLFCKVKGANWVFDNRLMVQSVSPALLEWMAEQLWEGFLATKQPMPAAIVTKGNGGNALTCLVRHAAYRISGLNLPMLFCRDERKKRGLRKLIEGKLPQDFAPGTALFVDDLFNAGNTVRSVQASLESEGFPLQITHASVLVDFWHGSRAMRCAGVSVSALFTRLELGLSRSGPQREALGRLKWHLPVANAKNNPDMPIKGSPTLHGHLVSIGLDTHDRVTLDKETGDVVWRYSPPQARYKGDVCYAVSVDDDLLWSSYDGCLVKASAQTGELRWRIRLDDQLHSSPTLDLPNRRAFIGTERVGTPVLCGKGDVRCVDVDSGKTLWCTPTNGMIPGNCAYDVATQTVVVGSNDLHLYLLDSETGVVRHRIACLGEVKGSVTFEGKDFYAATNDGWAFKVCALTGEVAWRKRFGNSAFIVTPVLHKGVVVVCSSQKHAVGLDALTGEVTWVRTLRDSVSQRPTPLGDGTALFLTASGHADVLDLSNGHRLAASKVGSDKAKVHQPALFDAGHAIISTDNEGVFCYELGA